MKWPAGEQPAIRLSSQNLPADVTQSIPMLVQPGEPVVFQPDLSVVVVSLCRREDLLHVAGLRAGEEHAPRVSRPDRGAGRRRIGLGWQRAGGPAAYIGQAKSRSLASFMPISPLRPAGQSKVDHGVHAGRRGTTRKSDPWREAGASRQVRKCRTIQRDRGGPLQGMVRGQACPAMAPFMVLRISMDDQGEAQMKGSLRNFIN